MSDGVQGLTEESVAYADRRLPRRELAVAAATCWIVVAACAGLLVVSAGDVHAHPAVVLVVAAYVLAARVAFPLGTGMVVPTQPFLVALFALADPEIVPALVLLALVAVLVLDVVLDRAHPERVLFAGGDAVHALGPAVVLLVAGTVTPLVIAAAFAAQLLLDLGCSILRERLVERVRPTLQARVIGHVWAVDAALLPLGLLAALVATEHPLAPMALVPLVLLLAAAARDRATALTRAVALRSLATTDELTGLANHRRFQEVADAAMADRARTGSPVALLLLDVDDFKLVNDRHGHAAGDAVLRALGGLLHSVCRAGAEPARYGGEELAVVVRDVDAHGAAVIADRLRRAIAALDEPGCPRVTASVGVAVAGPGAEDKASLLRAADEAMYAAKAAGKDRVAVWQNARSRAWTPGTFPV